MFDLKFPPDLQPVGVHFSDSEVCLLMKSSHCEVRQIRQISISIQAKLIPVRLMNYPTLRFKLLGTRTNNISYYLTSELDSLTVRIIAVRTVCVRLNSLSSFGGQYYNTLTSVSYNLIQLKPSEFFHLSMF